MQIVHRNGEILSVGRKTRAIPPLEDEGVLVTGKESMPAWDGEPMDLRYAMDCLWRPHRPTWRRWSRGSGRPLRRRRDVDHHTRSTT